MSLYDCTIYCTIGKIIYSDFGATGSHCRKTKSKQELDKNRFQSIILFRLQIFWSGLFAEKFLDRTAQRDDSQQPEPISATDTLPRRIKCQLTELLSDAPGVYLQEWKQKWKYIITNTWYSQVYSTYCTVPLLTLFRIIMKRKVHYGKKRDLEKPRKRLSFSS